MELDFIHLYLKIHVTVAALGTVSGLSYRPTNSDSFSGHEHLRLKLEPRCLVAPGVCYLQACSDHTENAELQDKESLQTKWRNSGNDYSVIQVSNNTSRRCSECRTVSTSRTGSVSRAWCKS